jgi:hypothetical protein
MHDITSADLPREIAQTAAGTLRRHGTCVMAVGLGLSEGRTIVPIWPRGTRSEGADVLLPNGNPLRIGKKAGFRGRYADEDEQEFGAIASACGGEAFLVESGNRMYVWGTAAELVEMSDAVLRVRVSGINPRDPRADGMLTTIDATILEAVKGGGYHAGAPIKLRIASGMDSSGRAQASAHDPLYHPFGGLKRQLVGEQLLVFVDQDFYREQARVRGGGALPGYVGGSIFYRLDGDRIVNDGDSPAPATLAELRTLASEP